MVWSHVLEILESIIEEGAVLRPILATPVPGANGRIVILDGHHRWLALNLLGAVLAPVLLVDYERHVHLGTWREGVRVSRSEVYKRALTGRLFPPKTTRHRLLVDVSWEPTPLEELVPGCRDPCLLGGSRGQRRGQGA